MVKLIREYSKDLNVLNVEDDKDLSHSTKEVFENLFQSVDIVYDGLDGWDKYNNFGIIKKSETETLIKAR